MCGFADGEVGLREPRIEIDEMFDLEATELMLPSPHDGSAE